MADVVVTFDGEDAGLRRTLDGLERKIRGIKPAAESGLSGIPALAKVGGAALGAMVSAHAIRMLAQFAQRGVEVSRSIERLAAARQALGGEIVSDSAIKETQSAFAMLGATVDGLALKFSSAMTPAVRLLTDALRDLAGASTAVRDANAPIQQTAQQLTATVAKQRGAAIQGLQDKAKRPGFAGVFGFMAYENEVSAGPRYKPGEARGNEEEFYAMLQAHGEVGQRAEEAARQRQEAAKADLLESARNSEEAFWEQSRGREPSAPTERTADQVESRAGFDALNQALAGDRLGRGSELDQLNAEIKARRDIVDEAAAQEVISAQEYQNALTRIEEEGAERRKEIAERIDKEKRDSAMSLASTMFGNLATLQNTKSRQLFQVGKVAAIAQATVDTYKAAVASYSWGATIGGPPLGAAAAATAVAAGMANIANINATQFGGGGGGAQSSSNTAINSTTGATTNNSFTQQNARNITVSVNGSRFSRDDVLDLVKQINEINREGGNVFEG